MRDGSALTTADDGEPLPGKTVTFTTKSGGSLCSATTNAQGVATCNVTLLQLLGMFGGYKAEFAGDPEHLPSSPSAGFF